MKSEKTSDAPVILPVADSDPRSGEIKVVLNWNPAPRSFLGLRHKSVDLDLGCCYRLRDGRTMLIDGLQFAASSEGRPDAPSRQGCYTQAPYLWHHGDSRSSSAIATETISINPVGIKEIESVVVYAFIYEGASGWTDCNASVSVIVPGVSPYNIPIVANGSSHPMCAVLRIDFQADGSVLSISRLSTFHKGHVDMSQAYGWPFEFDHGKKS